MCGIWFGIPIVLGEIILLEGDTIILLYGLGNYIPGGTFTGKPTGWTVATE